MSKIVTTEDKKEFTIEFWTEADGWVEADFPDVFQDQDEVGEYVYFLCERSGGDFWRYSEGDQ